ncbi:uncharacterized protein LOC119676388 [Teleopsis dalmanni]|nr:uncharacterized protein LOC119676388 [Teleopsis dalmanni]
MRSLFITTLLCFLAVSANGSVEYASQSNSLNFGSVFKSYILAIKRIMPCGYPAWNLPVLAPITLDYYTYNMTGQNYELNGNLSNLIFTGLNDFTLIEFEYNTTTNHFSYDAIFTNMQLLGEYFIDALIELGAIPLNLKGSGVLNWNFLNLRVIGSFDLVSSQIIQNGVGIANTKYNFLFGDIINESWNDLWDIPVNNFNNYWSSETLKMLSQELQPLVNKYYGDVVTPTMNRLLAGFTMEELLAFLVNGTMELNAVSCT